MRSIRAFAMTARRSHQQVFLGCSRRRSSWMDFSKSYAMTGWRLGFGVMPEWLVGAVTKLMANSNTCAATFVQRAGYNRAERAANRGREHGQSVPAAPRYVLPSAERDSRVSVLNAVRRILCVRKCRRDGIEAPERSRIFFSNRRASRVSMERLSASAARVICASVMPIRLRIWLKRFGGSRPFRKSGRRKEWKRV